MNDQQKSTAVGAAIGGVAGSVLTDGSTLGTLGGAAAGGVHRPRARGAQEVAFRRERRRSAGDIGDTAPMSLAIFYKLLAIFVTVALGWVAGRAALARRRQATRRASSRNAAFYIFVPALLFRTTARIDLARAALAARWRRSSCRRWLLLLAVYGWQRRAGAGRARRPRRPCAPSPRPSATRCRSASRWRRRCSARPARRST